MLYCKIISSIVIVILAKLNIFFVWFYCFYFWIVNVDFISPFIISQKYLFSLLLFPSFFIKMSFISTKVTKISQWKEKEGVLFLDFCHKAIFSNFCKCFSKNTEKGIFYNCTFFQMRYWLMLYITFLLKMCFFSKHHKIMISQLLFRTENSK